jgi:hypothetical protein
LIVLFGPLSVVILTLPAGGWDGRPVRDQVLPGQIEQVRKFRSSDPVASDELFHDLPAGLWKQDEETQVTEFSQKFYKQSLFRTRSLVVA